MVIQLKKLLSDKAFLLELIGFVFLQVFIDIYRVFFESRYQIFGISLPEIVNIAYFGLLSLVFLLKFFKKPKFLIPVGIYAFLVIIYSVFHILNISKLNQNLLTGSELNYFKEIYFIIRTYLIPVFTFYYFICSNLKLQSFQKAVSILSLIISSNIILTNIFKVSFICYASTLEKNSFITRNIFEWFYNPDLEFPVYMTSKGWFYMGNQIGLILFMLFIFVLMNAFQSGKIRDYSLVLLNGIALIMIGTKVSTLGCCIVLALGLIFAVVFGVLLKQFKFNLMHFITYFVIGAIFFTFISHSPMLLVQEDRDNAATVTEEQQEAIDSLIKEFESNTTEEAFKEEFIKAFSEYVNSIPYFFGVEPEFLELFPIEENFKFWYNIITKGNNSQIDYRYLKSLIYDEVIQLNNNKIGDKLLGIGYISNFPYSERDILSQNIWFGYAGTALFIGPYLLLVLYGIVLALKKIKTCFVYQNAFFAVGICATFLMSYLAGHLFFGIFSITVFSFIAVAFYKFQTERQKGQ